MSGRRAKIGNPSVLARMIMLERKVLTPDVATGAPEALQRALEDVRLSKPTVSRDSLPVNGLDTESIVLSSLRRVADRRELTQAADVLGEDFPALADLLRRAGKGR
jgi:hypothetical protein